MGDISFVAKYSIQSITKRYLCQTLRILDITTLTRDATYILRAVKLPASIASTITPGLLQSPIADSLGKCTIARGCSFYCRSLPYFSFEKMIKHRFLPFRNGVLLLLSANKKEKAMIAEKSYRKKQMRKILQKEERKSRETLEKLEMIEKKLDRTNQILEDIKSLLKNINAKTK